MQPAYENQDRQFATAFGVLLDAVEQKAFPAVSTAITHRSRVIALKAFGRFTYERIAPAVEVGSVFDLASVTKVVATTTMTMLLYERGKLDLEACIASVMPEFKNPTDARRENVTFRMLLAHTSGLPAYEKLFLHASNRQKMLEAAARVELVADPGSRADYSDVGFILLGHALERIAGEGIDSFCQREVFGPLGMANTRFCPPHGWRYKIPPTEGECPSRRWAIQGEVQDENARAMGGVAGHAGLFAPAEDVARFAVCMLGGGAPILRAETVSLFTKRDGTVANSSRALGWDTPSQPSQSGRYLSSRAYGHLGYAGTSLWIDPERELSVTLLTNRTWPDRKSELVKQVRPAFHDAVVEALG